jgi:hypothetical protein
MTFNLAPTKRQLAKEQKLIRQVCDDFLRGVGITWLGAKYDIAPWGVTDILRRGLHHKPKPPTKKRK